MRYCLLNEEQILTERETLAKSILGGNRTVEPAMAFGGQATSEEEAGPGTSGLNQASSSNADTSSIVSEEIALDDNDHRYVGLVNQAMTCYLNSLIQTLYMTPEFRNALYE